jgi:hypothetical protein
MAMAAGVPGLIAALSGPVGPIVLGVRGPMREA